VSRLKGYIFGDTWIYALCNYFRLFKTQRCGLANKYQGPFSRISKYGQDDKGSSDIDILIYCDQTRIRQNPEGLWVDTINRFTYNRNSKSVINACFEKVPPAGSSSSGIVAYTSTKPDGTDRTALIQLCPRYMKSQKKNFRNKKFVSLTHRGALRNVRELSTNPGSRPDSPDPLIEYFALLDHTILHEVCITAVSCTD
jgi:hypothetical protein